MSTRIYKLFGSATADTNALAQLTIQRPGTIVSIWWSYFANSQTDQSGFTAELSFSSTIQDTVNDTVGPISEVRRLLNFTTSGESEKANNALHAGIAVPVQAGDRLYLNFNALGTLTSANVAAYIAVEER